MLRLVSSVLLAIVLAGCATQGSDLLKRQNEIQDCILKGGHPRPGTGNTVECVIPI